ncbi:MAG: hypothetical protein R8G66_07215 [Cytophagales bacterium]|nr:hypothetical protein [Cytophagales bacterium]
MSTNNTFSLPRFIQLAKQSFAHHQRLILFTLVGFSGALFILFFLVQLSNDLNPGSEPRIFLPLFMVIFIGGGLLFVGNSFSGFRAKEKTISFLMLPASSLEKFLLELISKLIVLFILVPAMFWIIFHFEGYVFQVFYPDANFSTMQLNKIPELVPNDPAGTWIKSFISGLAFMGLMIAFTGAAHFERYPLVKTLFVMAVIFFSSMGILYVVIEKLGLAMYHPNDSLWLFPNSGKQAIGWVSIIVWSINLVLLTVSFLKIKEKEV